MNEATRSALSLRNPSRLRGATTALALAATCAALVFVAACGQATATASADHKCADKVAQATTTTAPVLGLWNCLTPAFQDKLKAAGAVTNGAFDGALSIGVAVRTELLGATTDFATYELILNPGTAQRAGVKQAEITVWLDNGKVDNVGVASPAF